jgi:hypothetical protein
MLLLAVINAQFELNETEIESHTIITYRYRFEFEFREESMNLSISKRTNKKPATIKHPLRIVSQSIASDPIPKLHPAINSEILTILQDSRMSDLGSCSPSFCQPKTLL